MTSNSACFRRLGATSGIGAETARVLAKRGVRVVIGARDMKKAERVKESIEKESPEAEIIIMEIDLSSFASIQTFCSHFLSLGLPLHILMYVFLVSCFCFCFVSCLFLKVCFFLWWRLLQKNFVVHENYD